MMKMLQSRKMMVTCTAAHLFASLSTDHHCIDKGAFGRKAFRRHAFLHTDAFSRTSITHKSFCARTLLRKSMSTQTFAHRCWCTEMPMLVHKSFTRRQFYWQSPLRTDAPQMLFFPTKAFTHKRIYTFKACCSRTMLHTEAFTPKGFGAKTFYAYYSDAAPACLFI